MIEVLARLHVPFAPVDNDEVARKGDLAGLVGGAHFGVAPPATPGVGQLWTTPGGDLAVWTGSEWLPLTIVGGALVPDWESDVDWDDPRFVWGS